MAWVNLTAGILLTLASLLAFPFFEPVTAFVTKGTRPVAIPSKKFAIRIEGYDEAFKIIDQAAETGILKPDLKQAVRFIEVNSYKIYPAKDPSHSEELWRTVQGSWKLTASTGSHKSREFHAPPWFLPFSFAMIDGPRFGNGIGLNQRQIGLSLLHHAHFHRKHRALSVTHPDMYMGGHRINLPEWLRPSVMKVVEEETDSEHRSPNMQTKTRNKKVPTFVLVGASKKALIARGNQSGGLALWTRLPEDIREVAFDNFPSSEKASTSADNQQQMLPQ